jgi:hypothetical protein
VRHLAADSARRWAEWGGRESPDTTAADYQPVEVSYPALLQESTRQALVTSYVRNFLS